MGNVCKIKVKRSHQTMHCSVFRLIGNAVTMYYGLMCSYVLLCIC